MRKFICWIFGHKYFVIKEFNKTTRKLGCRRCGRRFGMNDYVKSLLDWDGELEELTQIAYPVMGEIK